MPNGFRNDCLGSGPSSVFLVRIDFKVFRVLSCQCTNAQHASKYKKGCDMLGFHRDGPGSGRATPLRRSLTTFASVDKKMGDMGLLKVCIFSTKVKV